MLPEGDILPDLPLRTLDLSAAHESSITSNDVFVDVCELEPLDCRIRHTVVVRCWFYEAVSIFTLQVDPRYGDFHCDNTVLSYTQTERGLSAAALCGEPAGLNRGAPSASTCSSSSCLLSGPWIYLPIMSQSLRTGTDSRPTEPTTKPSQRVHPDSGVQRSHAKLRVK